jgi:hypothetical protein
MGADKRADDSVREMAIDLLVDRGDVSAKDDLIRIVRSPGAKRLRAAAVLALASIPDDECVKAVMARLDDTSPLVRATAALGATRFHEATARAAALRTIEHRLKQVGDKSRTVRRVLGVSRDVLSGARRNVDWGQVFRHSLFRQATQDYEDRLLIEVNRTAESCLDLRKITNLGSDTQLVSSGPPGEHGAGPETGTAQSSDDDGDTPDSSDSVNEGEPTEEDSGGEDIPIDDTSDGVGPPELPDGDTGPRGPGTIVPMGSARTSAWQELRDLKMHLRRLPYFGRDDLPTANDAETPR